MFGIIYLITNLTLRGIGSVIDFVEDNKLKKTTYDPRTNTYRDHNFARRDYFTNEIRTFGNVNGDEVVQRYTRRGLEIVKNLDEERRQREAEILRSLGDPFQTVVLYNNDSHTSELSGCVGRRYMDIYTGELYVERYITKDKLKPVSRNVYTVYVSVKTGKAVRFSDRDRKLDDQVAKKHEEELDKLYKTDRREYARIKWNLGKCWSVTVENGNVKVCANQEPMLEWYNKEQEKDSEFWGEKSFMNSMRFLS